ncbi:MAG: hypothetical protein WC460_02160 [Patescibacteria group bacterium]
MMPIREDLYFSNVKTCFDSKGNLIDKSYLARCKIFFTELKWCAETLKSGREKYFI